MHRRFALALLLVSGFALRVPAQTAAQQQQHNRSAEQFLEVIGIQNTFNQVAQQFTQQMIQQHPELGMHRNLFVEFVRKQLDVESMKPQLVELVTQTYTATDLEEILRFYNTPVGRKVLETMPALSQQILQLGVARLQQNAPQWNAYLQERLQE